jgi:hypothetical protein
MRLVHQEVYQQTLAVSIDAAVLIIKIEQEDWVEEVLNDGMVGMLNIQCDNLITEDESDLSCLL